MPLHARNGAALSGALLPEDHEKHGIGWFQALADRKGVLLTSAHSA
jgi:hypothetical protein